MEPKESSAIHAPPPMRVTFQHRDHSSATFRPTTLDTTLRQRRFLPDRVPMRKQYTNQLGSSELPDVSPGHAYIRYLADAKLCSSQGFGNRVTEDEDEDLESVEPTAWRQRCRA
jgi:hypothetical protein